MKKSIIYIMALVAFVGIFMVAKAFFTTSEPQPVVKEQQKLNETILQIPDGQSYVLKVEPDTKASYTKLDSAHFSGRVASPSSSRVSINKQVLEFDKDGSFESSFFMGYGENKYIFVYEDLQSGKREEKIFSWIVDRVAPEFQLTKPISRIDIPYSQAAIDIEGEFILLDSKSKIEKGVQVQVNGTPLTISDDRRGFSGTIELKDGKHELIVVATDLAGNEAKKTLPIQVDTTPPVVTIKDFKIIQGEGNVALIHFDGSINEPGDIQFAGRPVMLDEKGVFQFEVYASDIMQARDNNTAYFVARDKAGNISNTKLPKNADFVAPYWLKLKLVSLAGGKATLEGEVSEANVEVHIGSVKAISDSKGIVQLKGVEFKQDKPVVVTTLMDQAGNESHIEQWVSVHPDKK